MCVDKREALVLGVLVTGKSGQEAAGNGAGKPPSSADWLVSQLRTALGFVRFHLQSAPALRAVV